MHSRIEIERKITRLRISAREHKARGNNPMAEACRDKIRRLRGTWTKVKTPFVFR